MYVPPEEDRPSAESLEAIIRSCVTQEDYRQATELIRQAYGSRISKRCLYLSQGDSERANELIQKVFEQLQKSLKNFNWSAPLVRWIFSIVRNVDSYSRRSEARHLYVLQNSMNEILHNTYSEHTLSPEQIVIKGEYLILEQEKIKLLGKALNRLRSEEKAMITLYFFNNHTISQISERLMISRSTVARRIREVLAKLKEELT